MLFDDFPLLDNRRLYLPSFDELIAVVADFTVAEISTLVGIALWCLLLAVPLTGIDRRDNVTATAYLLFLAAGGVTLVLAIPERLASPGDVPWQLATIALFAVCAGLKWNRRPARALPAMPSEVTPP